MYKVKEISQRDIITRRDTLIQELNLIEFDHTQSDETLSLTNGLQAL